MNHEGSEDKPFLIVTGSSAGGIDALRALLTGLPKDLPAAVVVAQHQDPTHESRLAEILGGHSALPVSILEERAELEAGKVYVVPANRDVGITDHEAKTYLEARRGAKPSIDRLFSSAAETYDDRVVAIVLSGMGRDGLAGARTVKEYGGTVIIQDPASAAYPSLPSVIPPTLVDLVARPEAMGPLLATMLRRTTIPPEPDQETRVRSLLVQLRDRTGIDFLQYKLPTIMRRISRLMVASGSPTLNDYLKHLENHPEAYQKLVSAFLIKVTEFFRDSALYDELRSNVLPRLIDEAKQNNAELRIWSAGTSTGEEAYSLAILCAELSRESDGVSVRIFGTDLDEEAIAFARHGIYGADILKSTPAELVERYFVRTGEGYEIGKRIRNMTVFGQHDLAQRSPFPRIDLVVCRNVLIYFTQELQTRALQLFAFALRDRGYLILGKAESTTVLPQYFQTINGALKIYQRIGERVIIPPSRFREFAPTSDGHRGSVAAATTSAQLGSRVRALEAHAGAIDTIAQNLLASPMGTIVVDRKYDIIEINASARQMLEIHGVGAGEDLIHNAQHLDRDALRNLIDAAFRGEAPAAINLEVGELDERRAVKIAALYDPSPGNRVDGVVLVITDVSTEVKARLDAEAQCAVQASKIEDLTKAVAELSQRQKTLLKANEEITRANSDLRLVNEQLLISAEETASSNEEIETLNEEMQATNEELETLNEELQATVEELNTTNDELQARSAELEQQSSSRETRLTTVTKQRDALVRALDSSNGLVAVFDDEDQLLYVSSELEDEPFIKTLDSLKARGEFKTKGGKKLTVEPVEIESNGGTIRIIAFSPR